MKSMIQLEPNDFNFMSCNRDTIRLGHEPCSNQMKKLAEKFLRPMSLQQAVAVRLEHMPGQNFFGDATRPRRTRNESDATNEREHTRTERERRSDHAKMFNEAQLRIPDPTMNFSRDHLPELVPSRYRPGKATKSKLVGKDDIHVVMPLQLDIDEVMIRRLYDRVQQLEAEIRNHRCHDRIYGTPPNTANTFSLIPQAARRRSLEDDSDHYDPSRHSPPKRHR